MISVIYEAFIPAMVFGHLYLAILIVILFVRVNIREERGSEVPPDDGKQVIINENPSYQQKCIAIEFVHAAVAPDGNATAKAVQQVPVCDPCPSASPALPMADTDPQPSSTAIRVSHFERYSLARSVSKTLCLNEEIPPRLSNGSFRRAASGALKRGNSGAAAPQKTLAPPPQVDNPVKLQWDDVAVAFTNSKGDATTVLQGQCGKALPGEVMVIMGPSGAGKSTLLDVLSARALRGGRVSGCVMVNGREVSGPEFVHLRAYVPQEDNFVASMTALETVMLHASLDLPVGTPAEAVAGRAQEVLQIMGLSLQQYTLVGGVLPGGMPLRGLSGGQKRRLNIACRVVAAPPVVFLDEPTSGLDSTAALKVLSYMKVCAEQRHTIIATLHQPRAAIWSLLDKVLFVALGRFMYLGPPDGVVPWFSGTLQFPYDAFHDGLPSDWVMDLLAVDMSMAKQLIRAADNPSSPTYGRSEMQSRLEKAAAQFLLEWRAREGKEPLLPANSIVEECGKGDRTTAVSAAVIDASALGVPTSGGLHRSTLRSWLHQLRLLLQRECIMITRNPADAAGRMGTCMYVAILEGLVFLALTQDGTSFQSRLGCIFISLTIVMELPFASMGLIQSDSWLLVREAAENMYSPSACFVARQIVSAVLNTANVIVYTAIAYGLMGLRSGTVHIWTSIVIQVLGYLIVCQVMAVGSVVMPTQDTAFMLAIGIVAVYILLANFLIRWQEITWGWVAGLRFLSPMYFAFGSLVENEFADRTFPCPPEMGASVACVSDGNMIVGLYTDYSLGTTLGVLAAWWAGLMVALYGGMLWRIGQLRGN